MFDWLFEGRPAVYVVLCTGAVLLFVAWWQSRKRYWLAGACVLAGLAGAYFLLDRLVETDREQVRRKVQDLAAGFKARSTEQIFKNISDQFRVDPYDKKAIRALADRALRNGLVDDLVVYDIESPKEFRSDFPSPAGGTTQVALVNFQAKPKRGGGDIVPAPFSVEVRFIRDPDGQWRLLDFRLFEPGLEANKPVSVQDVAREVH